MSREFGPCQKCGGVDILVRYHDGEPHCDECRQFKRAPESCRLDKCPAALVEVPHLRVHCRRCQFDWIAPVGASDSPEKPT